METKEKERESNRGVVFLVWGFLGVGGVVGWGCCVGFFVFFLD